MDRRVVRTRNQLRDALTELLKQKPVQAITVSELTEMVNISRGTFYLHYNNVFDMLQKIEEEMLDGLRVILSEAPEDVRQQPFWSLRPLYEFFARQGDFIAVLTGPNGDPAFMGRVKELLLNQRKKEMAVAFPEGNEREFEYLFSFLFGGSLSLLEVWLKTGQKESPEEMADRTATLIQRGVYTYFG